jgi:hypothetical protein
LKAQEASKPVKKTKRIRLVTHGWRVGSVQEFMEANQAEMAAIDANVAKTRRSRGRRPSGSDVHSGPKTTTTKAEDENWAAA